MAESCTTNISKAGKNLFARIPDNFRENINRGDKVRITIIERFSKKDEGLMSQALDAFINNPSKEKFKGNLLGYNIELNLSDLIEIVPKNKLKKLLLDALMK